MRRFQLIATTLGALGALCMVPCVASAAPVGGVLPDGQTINEDTGPGPLQRPRDFTAPVGPLAGPIPSTVNSSVIYLNNCEPNGCTVNRGTSDSTTDSSDIASGHLSAFSGTDATWQGVVSCMKRVFVQFGVTITDVDPGTAPHFEIMVAGLSTEVGMSSDIGGVADLMCSRPGQCRGTYLPNGLVFDFANETFYSGNVNEICATAAQEIAHDFDLDHVVDGMDPMTYNENFSGIRTFHNNEVCGSDCVSGKSPTGMQCTGTGGNATHACLGEDPTGATQSEITTILALFGPGNPPPPTITITNPVNHQYVAAGFPIQVTAADGIEVSSVGLAVDGNPVLTLNSGPFAFNGPSTLAVGAHHVVVTVTDDVTMLTANAAVDVTVSAACTKPGDCPNDTDTCASDHCEPGSGVQGGLGTTCTGNGDCSSGLCGSDGSGTKYCVDTCDATMNECPASFSCLSTGGTGGVCWPESGGGGGGCEAGGGGGPIGLGLGFAALLFARRRR